MSQINYSNLQADFPTLGIVWEELRRLLDDKRNIKVIEFNLIHRQNRSIRWKDFSDAMLVLEGRHLLIRKYAIVSPSTHSIILEPVYDSPAQVPEEVIDDMNTRHNSEDVTIIPVWYCAIER